MSTEDLLFELGTEELPAGEISGMAAALVDTVTRDLTQYSLHYSSVEQFSTPRRLAVLVRDVAVRGADQERHVVGPPLSAARDEPRVLQGNKVSIRRRSPFRKKMA